MPVACPSDRTITVAYGHPGPYRSLGSAEFCCIAIKSAARQIAARKAISPCEVTVSARPLILPPTATPRADARLQSHADRHGEVLGDSFGAVADVAVGGDRDFSAYEVRTTQNVGSVSIP